MYENNKTRHEYEKGGNLLDLCERYKGVHTLQHVLCCFS